MLRDGRADVALLHGPWDDLRGLASEKLLSEDQVAVVPRGHRLAARRALNLADLEGETMPRWPHTPTGSARGPAVTDAGQLMQLIALGQTIAVVPRSIRGHLRHDLVSIPVIDAPSTSLLLAWPETARSRDIAAFVQAAIAVAADSKPATNVAAKI